MDERELYAAIREWKIIPAFGLWLVPAECLIPEIRDRFPTWKPAPYFAWPALEDEA